MLGRLKMQRLPIKLMLWAVFCLAGFTGLVLSAIALYKLPSKETWRANMEVQRVVVDAATGSVSGLKAENVSAFDVGENTAPPDHTSPQPAHPTPEKPTEHAEKPAEMPQGPTPVPVIAGDVQPLRTTPLVEEIPEVKRTSLSLVKAPAPEASQKLGEQILPRKTEQGLAPSRLYARNFDRTEDQHLLAIILTDVGFSNDVHAAIMQLPPEIGVAVSPYAPESTKVVETMRNLGRETWAMLPTMTDAYPAEDPGPLGLIRTQKPDGAVARVQQVLASTIGSVGVVLPPTETITAADELWLAVLTEIDGRGLYTLSTRANRSIDQMVPDKEKQASVRRADLVLEADASSAAIRSKLSALTSELAAKDEVIVVASAKPHTIEILKGWLNAQQVFTLAPLSAVYRGIEAPPPPPEKKKSGGH